MSTRHNNGSHYENHQQAEELRDVAAHAHRAAEKHGQQEHQTGHEQSKQKMEHSEQNYLHAQELQQRRTNEHGIPIFGHAEIAALAYELWHARGCPQGSPEEDWFHAAEQLRSRR